MYYLYMKQSGEGCDYTIGCAQKLISLKATTAEDAIKEAIEQFHYHGSDDAESDNALEAAFILSHKIDMMPTLSVLCQEKQREREEWTKQQKREQIAKLKKELGE